jgi:hypothetical protein
MTIGRPWGDAKSWTHRIGVCDPSHLAEMIPEDFIWRKLSPKEAGDLLNKLREGPPRPGITHSQQSLRAG